MGKNREIVEVQAAPSRQDMEYYEIIAAARGIVTLGQLLQCGKHLACLRKQDTNAAFNAFCKKVSENRSCKQFWVSKFSHAMARNAVVFKHYGLVNGFKDSNVMVSMVCYILVIPPEKELI